MLALLPLAAAHADPTPHVHGVSPLGLLLLAGWLVAGTLFLRAFVRRAA